MTVTCRIKLDGRPGTMRWRGLDFRTGATRKQSRGDRLGRLATVAAEQTLAGTGSDFEVRTGNGDWHPLRMSADDARAIVARANIGTSNVRRHLDNLERIRRRIHDKGYEPLSPDTQRAGSPPKQALSWRGAAPEDPVRE